MDCKLIINSIGLIFTIIGIYIVYIYSPLNFDIIDGGDASTDYNKINKQTLKRNTRLKWGVYIVMSGSIVQLLSNFINN